MSASRRSSFGTGLGAGDIQDNGRREFIKQVAGLPLTLAAAHFAAAGPLPVETPKLPQLRLGKYPLSRLVCGANPFNAGSHLSWFVNQEMRSYYTPDHIITWETWEGLTVGARTTAYSPGADRFSDASEEQDPLSKKVNWAVAVPYYR